MKFPIFKSIITGILLVISGTAILITSSVQTQYQGIVAASQVNDDSVIGNALAFWFRSADIVGFVGLVVLVGLLAWIWVPYFKEPQNQNKEQ